jgi:excisionase family DNA binding protein
MGMEKLVLSINEAAAALSLSPWTIRKYIREGNIVPTRIGRRVLVEPSELNKLLQHGRETNSEKS